MKKKIILLFNNNILVVRVIITEEDINIILSNRRCGAEVKKWTESIFNGNIYVYKQYVVENHQYIPAFESRAKFQVRYGPFR